MKLIPIASARRALEIRPEGEGTTDRLRVMEPQPVPSRLWRNLAESV